MSITHGNPSGFKFHVCPVDNIYQGNWELNIKSITILCQENISPCSLYLSCNLVNSFYATDDSNSSYTQRQTPLALFGLKGNLGDLFSWQLSGSTSRITHPMQEVVFKIYDATTNVVTTKKINVTLFFDLKRVS